LSKTAQRKTEEALLCTERNSKQDKERSSQSKQREKKEKSVEEGDSVRSESVWFVQIGIELNMNYEMRDESGVVAMQCKCGSWLHFQRGYISVTFLSFLIF